MKHNTIHNFFFLAVIVLAFSSCKKWLDVQPETQLSNQELFKGESGFTQALAGVYSGMGATSLYGREMTYGTMDVLAGYYMPVSGNPTTYYNFYWNYPYKRSNASKDPACVAVIDGMWKGMYTQVANLNNILSEIDSKKAVFSGDNYKIIKGETLGLRAFLHLDLLRMYGPSYQTGAGTKAIPFVDTLASVVSPLLTVEQASDRIISELRTALSLMSNDPIRTGGTPSTALASPVATPTLAAYQNRRYHFNYYAVAGALARAYLWKGDKANALIYAKQVIEAQATRFPWVLDANLVAINNPSATNKDRTFTTEHIFALNVRALETTIPDYFAGATMQVGLSLITPSSVRDNIYESNTVDPRNQYLFISNGNSFYSTKLFQDAVVSPWFKYQLPLINISEMYYIAAECEPGVADGLRWLNEVRSARKLVPLTNIPDKDILQTEIQKEYEKEFICAGQLWFYYKRQNLDYLPYAYGFQDPSVYVFDMPEDEYQYGGR